MADTITKEELDHFFEKFKNSILDLDVCISNIEVLNISYRDQTEYLVLVKGFMDHYVYLAYEHCALDIYQLFIKNEKRSFLKLFNKLEFNKYDEAFDEILIKNKERGHSNAFKSKEDLISELIKLKELINQKQSVLSIVNNRRSSFYAHYDPSKMFPPENLDVLISIRDTAKEIFERLYSGFFSTTFLFNDSYWSVKPVLISRKFENDYCKQLQEKIERQGNND